MLYLVYLPVANPGGNHMNNKRHFSAPFLPDLLRFSSSSFLPFGTRVLQLRGMEVSVEFVFLNCSAPRHCILALTRGYSF